MTKQLTIIDNIFLPANYERLEVDDLLEELSKKYSTFPQNARIYHKNVALENDVTPQTAEEILHLNKLEGPFYVVNYPAGWELLIYAAIALIAVVALVALKPKIPNSLNRNVQAESPNNGLSARTNEIRIKGRIPDIFGTQRSTPDLLAVPYSVFEDNVEVEYTYMCIGTGTFEIDSNSVRDGKTPLLANFDLVGETIEVFAPNTSPNTTETPQLRIGEAITRDVITVSRQKSVNGQTLLAPNEGAINDNTQTFDFVYPNFINSNGPVPDFTESFVAGDTFVLTTSGFNRGATSDGNWSERTENININTTNIYNEIVKVFTLGTLSDGGSNIQTHSARFYANGRIQFQSLSNIGIDRLLDDNGRMFLELSGAVDPILNIDLSGKYIATVYDASTLIVENPFNSSPDWINIGTVTNWINVTMSMPEGVNVNLSGTYQITSLTANQLVLKTPDNIQQNSNWTWLHYLGASSRKDDEHGFISKGDGVGWVGPFLLDVTSTTEIINNFVCLNGLYKDDGSEQVAADVDIEIGICPSSQLGEPTGSEMFFGYKLTGSALKRSSLGFTHYASGLAAGRYLVRVRRITSKDLGYAGQISDEVKWRDLYSSSPIGNVHFGDVTTVYARASATQQALAIEERQINMLVTRMLPRRISGSTFTSELYATRSAADIISFICLDSRLGNRSLAEVNFDNIYNTVEDIKDYFGFNEAAEFNYTFDSANLSFEEIVQSVADAVFCIANRRGNVIELTFEKATTDSRLLFNHRNKVPGSETRAYTFGGDGENDNDGIEYEYVSPIDDAPVTLFIPTDQSAVKPKKINSIGIRSAEQAYLHAWRNYNKMLYRYLMVEFEATQEADLLSEKDRILVADNTRIETQDGYVEDQDGLIVELSQPVEWQFGETYLISLQLHSGIVENISVLPGVDEYHVILGKAPNEALVIADDRVVKTAYQIVKVTDVEKTACVVEAKEPNSNFTTKIQAYNYDSRYYSKDLDFQLP
jgi:hypothetical protein